jgi:hypothetical protein
VSWKGIGDWFLKFLDPNAMIEDRLHAFIFGILVVGLWRWTKTMPPGRKQTIATWAVVALALFLVVNLLAGIANSRQSGPLLKPHAGHISRGTNEDGAMVVICEMEVINSGSPSVARDWSMEVLIPNEKPIRAAMIVRFPPDKWVTKTLRGAERVFLRPNWLPDKAGTTPIATGGSVSGYVVFVIPNAALNYLDSAGTVYRVAFRDVHDTPYICDYRFGIEMQPVDF